MSELTHKDLQAAVKDINTVFELKPAIKTITSRPNLEKAIKDVLAPAVSDGDNRIDLLNEATINVYNTLIQPNAIFEVAAEMAEEEAQAEANLETVAAGEGEEECPAFGKEFDASAPECMECVRAAECAPMTKPKKRTKEEKAIEKAAKAAAKAAAKVQRYTRIQATCEVLQENINSPVTSKFIVDCAHAKYVEHGGQDDWKTAQRAAFFLFTGLISLGHMTKNKDKTVTYTG